MSYPAPTMPWWIVARREIMAKLTQKGFWISTSIVILIIVAAFAFTFVFASSQDEMTIGVTDDAGAQVVAIAADSSGRDIRSSTMEAADMESAVEDGDLDAGLIQTADGWDLVVDSIETSVGDVQQAVSTYMTRTNATALGIDPAALQAGADVELRLTGEKLEQDAAIALVTGLVLVIELLQGVLGWVQYWLDLPVLLVALHMLGASLLAAGLARIALAVLPHHGEHEARADGEQQSTPATRLV